MRTSEGVFECGDLALQRGGTLKGARIVYKTYGTLSPKRDNVIVYPTSYWRSTPTSNGWSTSSTASIPAATSSSSRTCSPTGCRPRRRTRPGTAAFPEVTTYDNVTQQRRLLNELFGVERVKMVYGWSMGAQQAYHWAALFGAAVERIVVNCGSAKTAPHNFVFLEGVRTAVQNAAHTGGRPARHGPHLCRLGAEPDLLSPRDVARAGLHQPRGFPGALVGGQLPAPRRARPDGPALDLAERRHLGQRPLPGRPRRWRWPASRPRCC